MKALRLAAIVALSLMGCSEPLTTREKGALVGAVGGAAVGGIVGSAVGHPGTGAAVGGAAGLGAGALIGDRVQAIEKQQTELDSRRASANITGLCDPANFRCHWRVIEAESCAPGGWFNKSV